MYALIKLDKYYMRYGLFDNFTKSSKGDLGDYRHASALYLRNNYRLSGKPKFLYHVVLNINFEALNTLGANIANILNKREFNLLVQSVDLPQYTLDVNTLNQYNRKRLNQTKVNFNPIAMTFHDDMAGLTTLLWESYYRYYFQDPNYSNGQFLPYSYSNTTYKNDVLNSNRYGLDKSHPVPFFNSIVVNQLYTNDTNPSFTSFTLVNPMIIDMQHDNMDQSDTGLAKSTIRFAYETVLYDRDYSAPDYPSGFRDPSHYDVTPGPLSNSISSNLDILRNNRKNKPFEDIISELLVDFIFRDSIENLQSPSQPDVLRSVVVDERTNRTQNNIPASNLGGYKF